MQKIRERLYPISRPYVRLMYKRVRRLRASLDMVDDRSGYVN